MESVKRQGSFLSACQPGLLLAVLMYAQARADTVPPAKIEEILVTAQKRTEKLSKVPISIAVLGRAQMDKQGVRDVKDVARLVPGLHLQTSDVVGDTNISIRGITSDTGAQTTGVYIDETPVQARQEIVGSNPYPKVFDLDRVEVLRGPQGTLFGAGSEGGTVRFITPAPGLSDYTGYFRSELSFTDGGSPSYETGGAYGGPIVPDKLGFRISLWDREDGGYINRVDPVTDTLGTRNANDGNSLVGRAALTWQVNTDFKITPAIFFQRVSAGDRDYAWEHAPPFTTGVQAPAFTEYAQIPQPRTDTFILPSLDGDYDLGWATLHATASYFHRTLDDTFDATAFELSGLLPNSGITLPSDPGYLSTGRYHTKQSNWTGETRLTSATGPDSVYSWVGGIYFQNNRSSDTSTFAEPFDVLSNYLSEYYYDTPGNSLSYFGEAPVDGKYSYIDNIRVLETDVAGFGSFTYQPLQGLKFSVGLRVAHSKYSYNDFQDGPYGPTAPTNYSGSKGELPVTPRFAISYQITSDQMIYATAAKGYRIGGANESVAGVVACASDLAKLGRTDVPHTFNSDSVWSYELGEKGSLLNGRLRFDASLFWIDWSGIQQQVLLPDCGYYYTANLGSAVSRGFDIEAAYVVVPGLTLSGNAGLTDARFTTTVTQSGNILAKAGDSLSTPEWTATAALEKAFSLPRDLDGYARIDEEFAGPYYRTGSDVTFSYNPYTRNAPATNFVSLRTGVRKFGWDASLFIDNALNSRTSLYRYEDVYGAPGLRDTYPRPLTVGFTLIKKI